MSDFFISSHTLARHLFAVSLLVLAVYLLFRARKIKREDADCSKIIAMVFAAAIINIFASTMLMTW